MITLNCIHCRATLEMDEAFAGGVCRCQHCGTIQTVPKNLKPGENGEGQAVSGRSTTKPHYQTGRHGGTGLDELSDAVTSSGLARGAMRGGSGILGMSPSNVVPQEHGSIPYASPRPAAKPKKKTGLMIILGAVGAIIVVGLLAMLMSKSGPGQPTAGGSSGTASSSKGHSSDVPVEMEIPEGANFLGLDLSKASSVIYLIDRGTAMTDPLDPVKASTYRSIESLGAGKKFAVMFWDAVGAASDHVGYPDTGLADANKDSVSDLEKQLQDVVVVSDLTSPIGAIQRAAALNPTDVVLVTAKGGDLEDDVVKAVEQAFNGKVRVHAVAVREDDGTVLKQIKDKTHGGYRVVTINELNRFSKAR